MTVNRKSLERDFFRVLNQVVEPAVRKGIGSSRFSPTTLIVLESIGFKSGTTRSTPLVATQLGKYLLINTVRGEQSFWVKNLQKQPSVRYLIAGKPRNAKAFVMMPGKRYQRPKSLPAAIGKITDFLAPYTRRGWAFVILIPRS